MGGLQQPLVGLSDDFNDNSIDLTKWSVFSSGSCGTQEIDESVRSSCPAGATSGQYTGYTSLSAYDLRAGEAWVELVFAGDQSNTAWEAFFQVSLDSDNRLSMRVRQNTLIVRTEIAGDRNDIASLAYDPVAMRWLRFRQAGTTTYFEHGPDAFNWAQVISIPDPFDLTVLRFFFEGGARLASASATAAIFDNFNVLPTGGADGGTGADGGSGTGTDGGEADAGDSPVDPEVRDAGMEGDDSPPGAFNPQYRVAMGCGQLPGESLLSVVTAWFTWVSMRRRRCLSPLQTEQQRHPR